MSSDSSWMAVPDATMAITNLRHPTDPNYSERQNVLNQIVVLVTTHTTKASTGCSADAWMATLLHVPLLTVVHSQRQEGQSSIDTESALATLLTTNIVNATGYSHVLSVQNGAREVATALASQAVSSLATISSEQENIENSLCFNVVITEVKENSAGISDSLLTQLIITITKSSPPLDQLVVDLSFTTFRFDFDMLRKDAKFAASWNQLMRGIDPNEVIHYPLFSPISIP